MTTPDTAALVERLREYCQIEPGRFGEVPLSSVQLGWLLSAAEALQRQLAETERWRAYWQRSYENLEARHEAAEAREAKLREVLERIERWEVPETTDGLHFSGHFGSNGERDYFRSLARAGLLGEPVLSPYFMRSEHAKEAGCYSETVPALASAQEQPATRGENSP